MSQHSSESIRIFENEFLEKLTHVHPIVPLLFWSPVVAILLYRTFSVHDLPLGPVLLVGLMGLFVWTFTEYAAHRFIFHFKGKSRFSQWLVFVFHGVHHDAPADKTRLVMPPAGAVILMALFWAVFSLVVPERWLEPFLAFFVMGYLIYDYIHYATHHFRMKGKIGSYLRRYHLQHHFSGEEGKYGVSSPLWDIIFRTR